MDAQGSGTVSMQLPDVSDLPFAISTIVLSTFCRLSSIPAVSGISHIDDIVCLSSTHSRSGFCPHIVLVDVFIGSHSIPTVSGISHTDFACLAPV